MDKQRCPFCLRVQSGNRRMKCQFCGQQMYQNICGCGHPIGGRGNRKYCDVCREDEHKARHLLEMREYRKRRSPNYLRGIRTRNEVRRTGEGEDYAECLTDMRRSKPTCRKCWRPYNSGFELDHIIPVALGGTGKRENLQPLCGECHKVKSREDRKVIRTKVLGLITYAKQTLTT